MKGKAYKLILFIIKRKQTRSSEAKVLLRNIFTKCIKLKIKKKKL